MNGARNVLVAGLGGLGDFISRWPLWQSLRRSFPRAEISYLGYRRHGMLLLAAGLCDRLLDFDDRRWATAAALPTGTDLVISVLGARGRPWLERAIGTHACRVVEIEPFPSQGSAIAVHRHIFSQVQSAGLVDPGPLGVPIPGDARARADGYWRASGMAGTRVIAIHPGSGSGSKNWPPERFEALAMSLIAEGMSVLVLRGEAEGDSPFADNPSLHEVREPDLQHLAALLALCDGYVGNDCGVSHLAALIGVRSLVIFGPTDPAVWAPAGEHVKVVTRRTPCAPCSGEKRKACAERRCLTELSVEDLLAAVQRQKLVNGSG